MGRDFDLKIMFKNKYNKIKISRNKMSLTPNPSYLDDWKDLKEYTHQKHEEAEKEKDQRDVTKDYVGEQISDYEVKDEAKEQAEYDKIYQKIADISAGGGVDLSPYLKIEDASANFATKTEIPDVTGFITEDDLADYAKKEDIPSVEGFVKEEDLADYAKKSDIPDVSGFITEDDLTDYAKKSDIPSVEGFVKEEDLEPYAKKTDIPDVSNFATISELNEGLAAKADKGDSYTKEESDAKYLTEHQSLDDYAKKSDIPEVPTKVSELENDVPFLVENDLNDYAKKTDIPDVSAFVTEETVDEKVDTAIAKVIADAPEDFDTLKEVADYIASDKTRAAEIEIAISNLQSQKADASTVYTKDEADAKFLTEHQDLSDYALKSDIPDISNLATKDELAEVEGKIPSVDAFATTEYVNSEIERVEEEIPDVTNLATKTEVEAVAAQIPSIDGLVTEEQLTEAVSDKATIAQVAAVDQKVDAIVVPDISNLATKVEVAEGDASVLNNVLGKMWNKGTDCFYTKKVTNGKTALIFNENDGGGSIFETSDLKSFVGTNDGGDISTGVHVQIYSKSKADNRGARLNVNPTGIFYGVGTSAVISPETEIAVKGDIPSVDGFATTEQLTAAVADKATISQVAAVDQKVDAIVVPDISNLATKVEVFDGDASVLNNVLGKMWNKGSDCFYSKKINANGNEALIFNEPDGGGVIYDDKQNKVKSFVGVNDGADPFTGILAQIYSKNTSSNEGARLNINPTGMYYGVGASTPIDAEHELAVKGDLNSKADADSVYTKEVCDAKFLTEHQDLSEYAKTADVSDGYVPIGEYNALVDKVKVLSAYVESFVTVDPKKREEANDTIVASLSDDNTSVVVPSEIKSIVYPETTKGLTVVAPLADDSSVQITSEKYFYLDNTSETGNTSTAINGIEGATSATTCYLTGTFETLTLTNISVSKASSKNAAVVSNVVIPATNETNISLSVALTEGATITNNSDKDVTITNQTGGDAEPTVYVVAPNSTVTVSGGQFGTFESTVGDSTLYINKSVHIKKLIVKKGSVIVNDYEIESHIDEIENDTEYTVTPKTIEVTTQSDWSKASSTPAIYEVMNDLTSTSRIAPGIFGSSARIKMNGHTVTCSDSNGGFVLRGSSHYIIENGKLDCTAGYGIWLAGAGTVELKDMVIDADSHALYIEKTGGNIYATGNCRFSVKGEDKRYVANYLDATYSGGWTHGFHFGPGCQFIDFNPAASMGEPGGPVNLLDDGLTVEHTTEIIEGVEHDIYTVVALTPSE